MKQNCALFIITCLIIFTLNTIIVCNHGNQHFLQPTILKAYAVIHAKGAPLENRRSKPIYQRIAYNGHKKGPFYKVSKFGSAKRPDMESFWAI